MTNKKFEAVLTHPIKWSVIQSQFPTEGRDKTMTLAIPVDAIDTYIKHLELLKDAKHRHSTGNVYDYEKGEIITPQLGQGHVKKLTSRGSR